MKLNQYFSLVEFIPQSVWNQFHESALWFIDPRLIDSVTWLREQLGVPLVCNNWHSGGTFQNRGFRLPDSTVGGKLSQHKFGRACDLSSPNMTTKEIHAWIFEHEKELIANTHFTTIEDIVMTPTWVHLDIREIPGATKLLVVKP